MHKKVRKPGRKAGRKAGRPKGSKNRVPPLPPPVPQEPEEARATAAATLNRLLLTCTDTTEARRLGAQIVLLTAAPRPPRGEPVPYTDTPRAKAIRQRAQDRHTEKDDEKNRTYTESMGTPHAPSPTAPDGRQDANGRQAAMDSPPVDPQEAVTADSAHAQEIARREASRKQSGEYLTPPLTPLAPPDGKDDFDSRVRIRMSRQAEAARDRGPADYNDPRRTSVTTLRERESDFPEPEILTPEDLRYELDGYAWNQ